MEIRTIPSTPVLLLVCLFVHLAISSSIALPEATINRNVELKRAKREEPFKARTFLELILGIIETIQVGTRHEIRRTGTMYNLMH